jgi:hypothetical protein
MSKRAGLAAPLSIALFACGQLLGFGDDDPSPDVTSADAAGGDVQTATGEGGPGAGADAASRFCATADAAYCEDFDRMDAGPDALVPPWFSYVDDGNGHVVGGEGKSPPNALVIEGTSPLFSEGWTMVSADGAQKAAIEVDVRIDAVPSPVVWLQITWNGAVSRHGFSINLPSFGGGSIEEIEGPVRSEAREPAVIPSRKGWTVGWHRVVLEVDWPASVAELLVDGTSAATVGMARPFTSGPLAVEIGAHGFDSANDPRRVLYDNLVVHSR